MQFDVTSVTTLQLQATGMAYAFFDYEVFPASVYGCKVGVQVGSPASTSNFFLHDDNGNAMDRMWFGGNGVESNSKCIFSINGSTITLNGTQYTITLHVTFKDPYNGSKYVWVDTYDNNGSASGWNYANASFKIQSQNYAPQTLYVTPGSGSSSVGTIQQYTITTRDQNGGYTLFQNQLVFNQSPSWVPGYDPRARCKIIQDSSFISLESDYPNQAYVNGGYTPFGSQQTISNSYCTVYPAMSSGTSSNLQTDQITFGVSFKSPFLGQVQDHIFSADDLGAATWDSQANGTWTWNNNSSSVPAKGTNALLSKGRVMAAANCGSTPIVGPIYANGVPVVITATRCTGSFDYTNFNYCNITGNGITAQLQNQTSSTFDIAVTAGPDADLGYEYLACGSTAYNVEWSWFIPIYNTIYKPNKFL